MNRDDIMRMAWEAGLSKVIKANLDNTVTIELPNPEKLERFAALVAAAEREECAKVCEQMDTHGDFVKGWLEDCAAVIRARGER